MDYCELLLKHYPELFGYVTVQDAFSNGHSYIYWKYQDEYMDLMLFVESQYGRLGITDWHEFCFKVLEGLTPLERTWYEIDS